MLGPSRSPFFSSRIFLIGLGLTLLILDQLTKAWVYHSLPLIYTSPHFYPYGGVGVFENFLGIQFSINHMTNSGAAWGLFSKYPFLLISFRLLLIIGLIVYLARFNQEKKWQIPLILIVSGAIGNVCDYFIYGHVIDMFHVAFGQYDFPIFNVADTCISLGMLALIFLSFVKKPIHDS